MKKTTKAVQTRAEEDVKRFLEQARKLMGIEAFATVSIPAQGAVISLAKMLQTQEWYYSAGNKEQ